MALDAFLWCTGASLGDIKGSVTETGKEDSIRVIAASHELLCPTDATTGLPTGKRKHTPFTITKEVDRATPLLYQAMVNNESLVAWKLQFWTPSPTGQPFQHYTVELTNASICDIRFEMLNNQVPENAPHREREHISFVYQFITWTWTTGGIAAQADW
jgi:type VI secretion system secreted protein Hcp